MGKTSSQENGSPARVEVRRLPVTLQPDPARTVIRPFLPSDPEPFATPDHPRAERIVARVLAYTDQQVEMQLRRVKEAFADQHRGLDEVFLRRFSDIKKNVSGLASLDRRKRLLVGAYFSAEYSFESAALFNPSAVIHPDQSGKEEGDTRLVIALRGIGEGHLSSVTFRTGIWHADDRLIIDDPSATAVPPVIEAPKGWADGETIQLDCRGSREPSETVLFPIVESQNRGIEDLRLTPFVLPDGTASYAGTYTALGSAGVRQEMLQTDDFRVFKMHPVAGDLASAKGMALFPRKVGGRYLAVGRQDNENLWLATSDDMFTWSGGTKILEPQEPWESIQIGNCGSPIEIDEGWLLLTHGVGVVRSYCIGAVLLDRDDPSKVLGRLVHPLIEPGPDQREGYVPNVVYSCGGIVRGRTLLLPYGVADQFTAFGIVSVDELVAAMR